MEFKDYYKTLEVDKSASAADIKKSFRKLARKYHPDVSSEENAQDKFKELNEAYEVLKDAKKREEYDQFVASGGRSAHQHTQYDQANSNQDQQRQYYSSTGNPEDFSDFFESMFGDARAHSHQQHSHSQRKQKGQDTHYTFDIPLEDAFNGTTKTVQIEALSLDKDGMVIKTPKTLNIKIPKGISEGKTIRLKNQGNPSISGGENGDLYIKVHILPHDIFSLIDNDINVILPISPWEAALGASIKAPTLKGAVNLKVPANSQSGKKLRLKGYGLTDKHDQYVQFKIVNPEIKNDEDKKQFENLSKHFDFNPRAGLGV
ncbi:DnaJ domain-containing protein [Francisellaceae bacterium]|nr:DnaJ domain-containing protein [Francisellaceae bacterium]